MLPNTSVTFFLLGRGGGTGQSIFLLAVVSAQMSLETFVIAGSCPYPKFYVEIFDPPPCRCEPPDTPRHSIQRE
ncbi:hypothetical protein EDD17DRAFT_1548188 [Pisolithus thermaeus]|nr:hypothetical protein EDD17DRAFT_1548188 [Pisolithus thermaeus]